MMTIVVIVKVWWRWYYINDDGDLQHLIDVGRLLVQQVLQVLNAHDKPEKNMIVRILKTALIMLLVFCDEQ